MRIDRVEEIPLRVMMTWALARAEGYVENGIPFQYAALAEAAFKNYSDNCRPVFAVPPAVRVAYEDEVRRFLLAEGLRRSWPAG